MSLGWRCLMMPIVSGVPSCRRKKNPDIAELTRGRTGRVYGALLDLLTNLKGLPMGYNRDFQEDKPPLWEAFDVVKGVPRSATGTPQKPRISEPNGWRNWRMQTSQRRRNWQTISLKNIGLVFGSAMRLSAGSSGNSVQEEKTFSDWELTQKLLKQREIDIPIAQLKQILGCGIGDSE